MKVVLICPSNMLYMPYVGNYEKILKKNNIDYDIINWDRFNIEDENNYFIYRDRKIGHQRNFLDYYKFKNFIIKRLNATSYDKVIVFGMQLTFFLKSILQKRFKGNYIIDIRDHNKIINYFNISRVIDNSSITVLSSLGYKNWLPNNKYVLNHNTKIEGLNDIKNIDKLHEFKKEVSIGCIGALRDYQINIDLIDTLKNNNNIKLNYHGEGDINEDINKYIIKNDIKNVNLTGRYGKEDEKELYESNDIINVLRYNDGVNNSTALPNRLYNAAIYGKPMLALKGTYLAEEISKHNLGLVISSLENIEKEINNYLENFDNRKYETNRIIFLKRVINENAIFLDYVQEFVRNNS